MYWLLGSKGDSAPETPAHKWALNAFKGVIMPETPFQQGQVCESPGQLNSGLSILKTPGQLKEKKNVNVTFHASVRTPPKKTARSGLPNAFPGKFPSPWTPKSVVIEQDDGLDAGDSPIGIERGKRDSTRFSNPLKALPLRLDDTKSDSEEYATKSRPTHRSHRSNQPESIRGKSSRRPRHAEPLSWDVEKGFEEVLESIAKNNEYLQTLIDEMQESCSHPEESFSEGQSMADSEATVNLDEPRSRSGQYWKAKFLDFNVLTECVKSEQNSMERALARLKCEVEEKTAALTNDWKDRFDVVKEELDREKRMNKNNSHAREMRDLRRTVKELQVQVEQDKEWKRQLEIADLEIKDLQAQLAKKETNSTRFSGPSSRHNNDHVTTNGVSSGGPSAPAQDPSSTERHLSSTSHRLTRARAQSTVRIEEHERSAQSDLKTSAPPLTRTTHSRFGSHSHSHSDAHIVSKENRAPSTFAFDPSFAPIGLDPPPSTTAPSSRPLHHPPHHRISPRPTFASLPVNVMPPPPRDTQSSTHTPFASTKSTSTGTATQPHKKSSEESVSCKVVENGDALGTQNHVIVESREKEGEKGVEGEKEEEAVRLRREAAQRRLDQRKAERSQRFQKSAFRKVVV